MGFFQKLRNGLSRFMYGRNGADHLCLATIWTAIALDVIAAQDPELAERQKGRDALMYHIQKMKKEGSSALTHISKFEGIAQK